MRPLALFMLVALDACSPPPRRDAAAATPAPVPVASAATSAAPSASPAGAAPFFHSSLDVDRRACATDASCQVTASCDCTQCIPSKRMEVGACAQPCAKDACAGHAARCDHGLCTTEGYAASLASRLTPAVLDDLSKIGQLVIDDKRVAMYFHETQRPERVPLVVAWEPRVPAPTWTKFGKPVVFAEGVPTKGAFLLPTQVTIESDKATLILVYAAEGATFHADLAKAAGAWSITKLTASER